MSGKGYQLSLLAIAVLLAMAAWFSASALTPQLELDGQWIESL